MKLSMKILLMTTLLYATHNACATIQLPDEYKISLGFSISKPTALHMSGLGFVVAGLATVFVTATHATTPRKTQMNATQIAVNAAAAVIGLGLSVTGAYIIGITPQMPQLPEVE